MTLILWLGLGEWRAQPVRNALSVAAIAIGVALGFAIHLVNAVALDDFTGGLNRMRGAADLSIVAAGPGGFDEQFFGRLMASGIAASIAVASPVVERDVPLADDPRTVLDVAGVDALRAARVTPALIGRPERSSNTSDDPSSGTLSWFDADAIRVPQALLAALGKKTGDPLAVRVDGDVVTLRIAGTMADDDASTTTNQGGATHRTWRAAMDIAGAQWRLHRLGRLSRIDLRLVEGSDAGEVRAALARLLPADIRVTDAGDDRARSGDLSRAYRVNLDMLALMALFTGAFLVYSTQSLAVARRGAQLALLRVIGTTRRRLVAQVLIEGAVQGIVGGLLGLLGGLGFAALVLRFFGGDLGSGAFAKTALDLHRLLFAAPEAAVLFFLLGFGAALAGSFFPARDAALAAPAAALKSAGSDDASRLVSPWLAIGLLAAGLVAASLPAIAGLPIAGYVAMALLLFGGIAAMPWLARTLLAPFASSSRSRPVAIDLALRRLWAAPSAASVALCGIVASASLMVAMTVMIASFRHSVDAWLGQLLSADLYLRTDAASGGLDEADVERLRRAPGVIEVDLQKVVPLTLDATKPAVSLIARTMNRDDPARSIPLVEQVAIPANADIPIWVSEAVIDLYHAVPGQPLALPFGASVKPPPRFVVAGVWRDYARQFGSIVMRREDYTRLTGDDRFTDAAIALDPRVDPDRSEAGLRSALPDALREGAEFARPAAIRALSLRIFDRSFAVTYLLQAVAIAIGLAGVAATFSAQTFARSREFGMLRHIGVLKRQIVGELASEGALLGLLGALAGGALGLAMSQVLIHVVNPQSFHWTMDTSIPWRTLALVGVALVAAAAGTAVIAGRRALAHDAVMAVREDW
jgi:putative ABC transport system permease protein